ncbi:TIGR02391 family protein [Nocardioides sp. Root140]|uniref:TIGR02391 family protein n=1 Tax=Nocardioides sp. Root140 TaxID=1736460 RepID=UPI0006FA5BF1|nr:TIGR02391 family protein [Nocardioides sp. Root140]KQY61439.1 hypothetical protein ASD30_25615 [Nocardioides sp. Root140]
MDAKWATEVLKHTIETCDAVLLAEHQDDHVGASEGRHELLTNLYSNNAIIRTLNAPPVHADVPLMETNEYGYPDTSEWRSAAHRAFGVARDMAIVAEKLRPIAPTMAADRLHDWVWNAAATFWETGQHAVAVEQAAKSLTAHIQKKSGSTAADRELVQDVFSQRPKPGATRLWVTGDRASDTWKSRQEGLHNTAMGAFSGIRNVVAHMDPGWEEQVCLELLAVLSTVARWAEDTEVVVCPEQV